MKSIGSDNSVVIIGDSHTGVFRRTQNSSRINEHCRIIPLGPGNLLNKPFFTVEKERIEFIDSSLKQKLPSIKSVEDSKAFVCGPLNSNRLVRSSIWDEFSPVQVLGDRELRPISSAVLSEMIFEDSRYLMDFVVSLLHLGWDVSVIEAPKPFRHHPSVSKYGEGLVKFVDQSYRKQVKRLLLGNNVDIIPVPESTYDSGGFSLDMYKSDKERDHHHGNDKFGLVMWDAVLSVLTQKD